MEDEKDVLTGKYTKSPAFAGYHIFAPAGHIERYMEDAIFKFHETKKDDPIMAATNLFGNVINIHSFGDGNGRICHLILAHVLTQMKCCLSPVILSSFHRRGRRHYIRPVRMFDRKPSMLYTIIVKSLIHWWDNVEQNARMALNFKHIHYRLTPAYRSTWPRRSPKFNKDVFCHAIFLNSVELCIVTINEKLWTRAREVCKALEYGKSTKAADVVRRLCSNTNYAHKWQLTGLVSETKPLDWPKDWQKYDTFTN